MSEKTSKEVTTKEKKPSVDKNEKKPTIHEAVVRDGEKSVYRAPAKKIQLSREYSFSGEWKSTLEMREPTIKDETIAREGSTNEQEMQELLFCNLCDIVVEDLTQFALRDALLVTEAYNSFLY